MRKLILAGLVIASAFMPLMRADADSAAAAVDFPLTGIYTQNVACKGDGSDQAALKVTISPQQILSNIGVCAILEKRHDGKSYKLHVECKFPAGPLVGDLTFTPQPNNTIKFVDRNNTYNAVLYRCPG
ncbi:MAG: hypothetical protein WBF58_10105 [Xanthobacteraceae bacterium]